MQDPTSPEEQHAQADAGGQDSTRASRPKRRDDIEYLPLWNNFVTMCGVFFVVMGIILIMTFGLFSIVSPTANPYVDIVGFLVLPSILAIGLIIAPIGIVLKRWRLLRKDPRRHISLRFPRIDLRDPPQRRVAKFFLGITFITLPVVGVSAYHGYHYTDSVSFCAQACHSVMEPEATTYATSPHARVSCAECHIGSGASWFVKAKLSGTRQVFATLFDSYPRPIAPAISNLRPARETCERCHWPQKFYGAQLAELARYASDETNSRSEIDMLLKIGGGDETTGPAEGIHQHMALAAQIEYVATDDKLQNIPWIKWTDNTGREFIYRSDGRPSSDVPPEGSTRNFDCMDCHNRPAHEFRSPQVSVDSYLEIGRLDRGLPFIKREAVKMLVAPYPDSDTASARISKGIMSFYQNNYPDLWNNDRAAINQAVDSVRQIYNNNFFPQMRVDWQTYPDNIGHKFSAGCFRCHDGKHINQFGEVLSYDCNMCHTFLNPVNQSGVIQEGGFVHPTELGGIHAQVLCHECHDGGPAKPPTCDGCHSSVNGLLTANHPLLSPFDITPDSMAGTVGCTDCHDTAEPVTLESVDMMCLDCHEDEEGYEGMLANWAEQVNTQRSHAEKQLLQLMAWIEAKNATESFDDPEAVQSVETSRQLLEYLNEAEPLHNYRAALQIYEAIATEAAATRTKLERARPQGETATQGN